MLPPASSSKNKAFPGAVQGQTIQRVQDLGFKITTEHDGADYNAYKSETSRQEVKTAAEPARGPEPPGRTFHRVPRNNTLCIEVRSADRLVGRRV